MQNIDRYFFSVILGSKDISQSRATVTCSYILDITSKLLSRHLLLSAFFPFQEKLEQY